MATTKAVIRSNRINEKGLTPIFIRYTHQQVSILFAVGQLVKVSDWDASGSVRKTMRGYTNINSLIEKKKRLIDDIRIELQLIDIEPTVENVRDAYNRKHKKQPDVLTPSQNILDHWEHFVQFQINIQKIAKGTVNQYASAKKHLLDFEKVNKLKLTFEKIDKSFYECYLYHLYSVRSCSPNTVGNQIKFLKAFMNWCVNNQKLTTNIAFKEFLKPKSPTQIFTLTREQLDKIYLLDLTSNEKLARVRDIFCLCCTTGLRYSDAVRLTKGNIKGDHIIINTKKTNDTAFIPLNEYSSAIVKRYPERLPKISNQKMNDYLKELGKLADLVEEHEVITFKSGIKEVTMKPLHDLMSSHMARRTFITQSLERGMLPSTVMKISTHRDVKSFNLYINTTKARITQEVLKAWNSPANIHESDN